MRGAAPHPAGGNNSPRAPLFLSASYQRTGAPGRFRAARPVVMNRRNSLPPLSEMTTVQVVGQYSVSGADGRWRYSGKGKCHNSPRAPLFRLAASPRGGCRADVGCRALRRPVGRGKVRKGRRARRALFGLPSQCRRVLPHPPAVADRCFASRKHRCCL